MFFIIFHRSYTHILDTFKAVNDNSQMLITKSKVTLSKFDLIYYHILNQADLACYIRKDSEDRQVYLVFVLPCNYSLR